MSPPLPTKPAQKTELFEDISSFRSSSVQQKTSFGLGFKFGKQKSQKKQKVKEEDKIPEPSSIHKLSNAAPSSFHLTPQLVVGVFLLVAVPIAVITLLLPTALAPRAYKEPTIPQRKSAQIAQQTNQQTTQEQTAKGQTANKAQTSSQPLTEPPIITTSFMGFALAGTPYRSVLEAYDPENNLPLYISTSALPPGIQAGACEEKQFQKNGNTYTGISCQIGGTAEKPGKYVVEITATNSSGAQTKKSVSLIVGGI